MWYWPPLAQRASTCASATSTIGVRPIGNGYHIIATIEQWNREICQLFSIQVKSYKIPSDWWNNGMQSVKTICPVLLLPLEAKSKPLTAQWGCLTVCKIIFEYARGSNSTSNVFVSWLDVTFIVSEFRFKNPRRE